MTVSSNDALKAWAYENGCRYSQVYRGGLAVGAMAWGPVTSKDPDVKWDSVYKTDGIEVKAKSRILFARTSRYVACWRLKNRAMALDWAASLVITKDAVDVPVHVGLDKPIMIRNKDKKEVLKCQKCQRR